VTSVIEKRNAELLGTLEKILSALGYEGTQLLERSEALPLPSVLVPLAVDAKGRARFMTLMIYPAAELEHTVLLQYFAELPFAVADPNLTAVYLLLPSLNHRVVVGHFGLAGSGEKPYFRYVQALRADEPVTQEHVADVLTLFTATADMFQDILEDVASGKASPAQGSARADSLYEGIEK
jgi:hypothetical protein